MAEPTFTQADITAAQIAAVNDYRRQQGSGQNVNPPPPPSGTPSGTPQSNTANQSTANISAQAQTQKQAVGDIVAAGTVAIDGVAELAEKTTENILGQAKNFTTLFDNSVFAKMQTGYGIANEAYDDLNKFAKNSDDFAANEVGNMLKLSKAYYSKSTNYKNYFRTDADFMKRLYDTSEKLMSTNYRALKSFDDQERGRVALFEKNLDLAGEQTAKLLNRTYAETGETSDKILQDITAHASAVSKASGMSMKDLADEMANLMASTDKFGFKSAEQAARIASTYKQLGLDLQTFSNLVTGFRDFDTAASKMGDLSAMFGVQMDAMEMMYLANEDEEQFLHQMREQMLDQGVDVDNMSNTRLRALSDQMGMSQEQLKTFFRDGELIADQGEQQKASEEANQMGLKETQKIIEGMKLPIARTKEEFTKMFTSQQMADKIANLGKLRLEAGELNKNIAGTVASLDAKALGVDGMYSTAFNTFNTELAGINKKLSKGEGLTDMAKELVDVGAVQTSLAKLAPMHQKAAVDSYQVMSDEAKKANKTESPPKWMHSWQNTLDYVKDNMAPELAAGQAAAASGAALAMKSAMTEGLDDVNLSVDEKVRLTNASVKIGLGSTQKDLSNLTGAFTKDTKLFMDLSSTMGLSQQAAADAIQKTANTQNSSLEATGLKTKQEFSKLLEAKKNVASQIANVDTSSEVQAKVDYAVSVDVEAVQRAALDTSEKFTTEVKTLIDSLVTQNSELTKRLEGVISSVKDIKTVTEVNLKVGANELAKAIVNSDYMKEAFKDK